MRMITGRMDESHIDEALRLAVSSYERASEVDREIPGADFTSDLRNGLTDMVRQSGGVIVMEEKKVIGFMTGYGPFREHFGKVKGMYTPLFGHGVAPFGEDADGKRARVYDLLHQEASRLWLADGILSHAIALYSHDREIVERFFENGFGMRCMDAIKKIGAPPMEMTPTIEMSTSIEGEIEYCALGEDELDAVVILKNGLIGHLKSSPMYMPLGFEYSREKAFEERNRRQSSYYGIRISGQVVAFMEVMDSGENFIGEYPGFSHICGAYMLPEWRGRGLFEGLLRHVELELSERGATHLGVDFESFNPTARGFWLKHFKPYTYSLVRRLDERILALDSTD